MILEVPVTKRCSVFTGVVIFLMLGLVGRSFAQGDGPRSHLLGPIGIWGVNPKYLNLDQNIVPAGNILVEDADIKVDVFPTTFFHTLNIGGKFAQILFMANPGKAVASIESDTTLLDREITADGFSDGFIGFKLGLIGGDAMDIGEFAKHQPSYSLYGYLRVWYSGSYDSNKLFNLGTNRFAIELGAPMSIPVNLGKTQRSTWLEVFPSVQFFTDNDDPARSSRANKVEQKPLFLLESHFTHNITTKFWAGLDLRLQYGGETLVDDVGDDNRIEAVGGGLSLGYQILKPLGGYVSYGRILTGDNNAQAEMLRVSLVFTYINIERIQQSQN